MDYRLFRAINGLAGHGGLIDHSMIWLAKYGPIVFALFLGVLWFSGIGEDAVLARKTVLRAVVSAALALGLNQLIGLIYFRPRPFATHEVKLLLPRSGDPSFPSDHSTGAAALTASAFGVAPLATWGMTALSILLMVSRVYVGLHYPLDVLGGAVTGILGSFLVKYVWVYLDPWAVKLIGLWDKVWFLILPRPRSGAA